MASKTINLASSGIGSLTNIGAAASTGSYYQTPSVSKGGGTYQIYIPIDIATAIGVAASNVTKITFKYEICQERYGVLSSAGTVATGYKNSSGSFTQVKNHDNGIGKGTSAYEPYSDEITSPYYSGNTITLAMKITNVINAQTCYYRIRNVSFVIEYNEPHKHSYKSAVTKQPTCISEGETTYTCDCGDSYTESIGKLSHSYTGAIKNDSHGINGTHSFKCVNGCNNYGGAVQHTWSSSGSITTQPTCTHTGVKTYKCTVSGCDGVYTEEVPMIDHTPGAAATCRTAQKCTVCGLTLAYALGHSWDTTITYVWSDDLTSCTATRVCVRCGATQTATATDITSSVLKQATCTSKGTTKYNAVFYGTGWAPTNVKEVQDIPALGHTEVVDKAVAPTCTTDGLTEGKHCSACNVIITAQQTVPAKGHNYASQVIAPTAAVDGYTLHTCQNGCGSSYKDNYTINKIFYGTKQPSKIFFGTQEVKEVYFGTTKVFGTK